MMNSVIFMPILLLVSTLVFANEAFVPSQIIHDPFQMPQIKQKPEIRTEITEKKPIPKPLKLFSTLRSGKKSLANINGRIIKLGEQIEGYKLITVDERSVTLILNRKTSQITLDDSVEAQ